MATFTNYNKWTSADTSVGLQITSSAPVDRRFVVDTFDNISSVIPKARRYPGLRVYVMDEEKEYWFKSGVNTSNLVEYHPESMYAVSNVELEEIDTSHLTTGSEITIFTNGNPTKYVWNGSSWKSYGGTTVSETIPTITTNVAVDTLEELSTLINNHLTANGVTATYGTEVSVVFVDTAETDPNLNYFNKYVFLADGSDNGRWFLENGTQVFGFSIPSSLETASDGQIVGDDSDTSAKYIKYKKNGDGVDVIVEHNFCIQYIDVSIYQKNDGESDRDSDGVTDSDYGSEVMVPHHCIKSGGRYRVVISFPTIPDPTYRFNLVLQR